MANEAVSYEKPMKFARYTVANGIGISKGTILKLITPNTATACAADDDPVAGIAMMEKVANDGSTEISAALDGVWGLKVGTAAGFTVGYDVVIKGANQIGPYTTLDNEKGFVLGKALETVASSAVAKIRLNI